MINLQRFTCPTEQGSGPRLRGLLEQKPQKRKFRNWNFLNPFFPGHPARTISLTNTGHPPVIRDGHHLSFNLQTFVPLGALPPRRLGVLFFIKRLEQLMAFPFCKCQISPAGGWIMPPFPPPGRDPLDSGGYILLLAGNFASKPAGRKVASCVGPGLLQQKVQHAPKHSPGVKIGSFARTKL